MTVSSDAPEPRAAYTQWIAACSDAGWQADPVAEQVPVQAVLGRVTAAAVRARWPSPRCACAAMDGIAVAARDAEATDGDNVVLSAAAFPGSTPAICFPPARTPSLSGSGLVSFARTAARW